MNIFRKFFERFVAITIIAFCILIVTELMVNLYAFSCLIPIKNKTSYGYLNKITGKVIIPLNKYSSRIKSQIALPYEIILYKINNINLIKSFNGETHKFGFVDEKNNIVIQHKYKRADSFKTYAIVAIEKNGRKKYGTIDKKGNWVIKPNYNYICPFEKYYTKACIDDNHCGIINPFGDKITLMSYKINKLHCNSENCKYVFCGIGKKNI